MSAPEPPDTASKTNWFLAGPAAVLAGVLLVLLFLGYFNFDDGRVWWGEFYDCRGALEAYLGDHGGFPPATVYSKEGVPLYSWRLLLARYLWQPELYDQFHMDEPWDSPHNRKFLPKMPSAFRPPASKQSRVPEGHTLMRAVVLPETVFAEPQKERPKGFFDHLAMKPLLILEAGEPVPWTKPEQYILLTDKPLPELAGLYADDYRSSRIPGGPVRFLKRQGFDSEVRAMLDSR